MASGFFQSNTGVNCNIRLEWTSTANVADNTSSVNVKVYLIHHALYVGSKTLNISCMGAVKTVQVKAFSTDQKYETKDLIGQATFSIPHNSAGEKTGVISAEIPQFNVTYGGKYLASIGCSGTAILDAIPRASQLTLSADSVAMGDTLTITINKASETFTHSLYYYFGGLMYEPIPVEIVDDVCEWVVPRDFAYQIPNATQGKCNILLETYNSEGVLVGAVSADFTATVPDDITPVINEIICTGQAFHDWMVQGKSQLGVEVDASGTYGSTIVGYKITANGGTYIYNKCSAGLLQTPGTHEVTAEVTDSRGRTATATTTYYVVEYAAPTIYLKASRCDASLVPDDEGEYIDIRVSASISPINNVNQRKFVLEYKAHNDADYTLIEEYTADFAYSPLFFKPFAADPDNAYTVRLTATDIYTTVTYTVEVPTAFTLMDFNASGKGLAIGKVSEQDAFECALPANMERAWFGHVPMDSEFYTNSEGYKGRVFATNWFASYGPTGWYNDTYKGGWYMSDASWIRAYGDKNIYTARMMYAGQLKTVKGNDVDTMAAQLAQCVTSEYTVHSDTDTYFCESYKYSDGRMVINQRQLVSVDINNASGGIFWGNASLNDFPVEFEKMPTVTLSTMTGTINAFVWGNYGTELPSTTNAGQPLLGRGEAASGKVWVCVHAEGRYTVETAVAEAMNNEEEGIL